MSTDFLRSIIVPGAVGGSISAIGGLFTALLIFRSNRHEMKWSTTLQLLGEFNSPEMSRARNQGYRYLSGHLDKNFEEIGNLDVPLENGQDPRSGFRTVLRFYEKLSILQRNGRIVDGQVLDLFGSVFVWWWEFTFSAQLTPTDWQAAFEIQRLHDWMAGQARRQRRTSDWHRWGEAGRRDRQTLKKPLIT